MPIEWRTSSYTNADACVEVATGREVLVRDTKDREAGHITVPAAAWHELLNRLN
ncbi:DUF397 domain-containing protein [Amycolatopsis rhabdoformis]|uniref:DUF397 domain-containing protein n=1 Tax=Amycolatopsis rhabdoformis TaxID=1448059 RepID=A0ABZ1HZ66_9PSEU|nr:DUF397 domain-containing protein [Amycolatopsis rhabdoformis]WSE27245.1 DUF397 domain-containing protein [Amycolatopsis rhabdoformis]